MACIGCSCGTEKKADGKVAGCQSNGGCSTGGCNRMNTYDWISVLDIDDPAPYPFVEVSFKNGTNKEFYKKDNYQDVNTGDWVVVETASGQDVGKITLSGELVRLQMKKKNWPENRVLYKVVRLAGDRDLDHMRQARDMEKMALVKGRVIARSLGLDMKISEIAYQADLKKATFYYIADRRIDFRELVKLYAKEFRIKVEMRQIGARQESALIGGIGSCGRELCCSTWLSDFKTVVTSAARYQNLAINQAKLSGQCGRLKCCLNYELDVYMESLQRFPMDIEVIVSKLGKANLVKTDIFRGVMYYELDQQGKATRDFQVFGLSPEQVRILKAKNDKGEIPADFGQTITAASLSSTPVEEDAGFADVTGEIELPEEKKRKKNKNRGGRPNIPQEGQHQNRHSNQNRPNQPNRPRETNNPGQNSQNRPSNQNDPRENRPNQNQNRPANQNNPREDRANNQRDNRPNTPRENRPTNQGDNRPTNPRENRPPRPPFNKDQRKQNPDGPKPPVNPSDN